MGVYKRRCGEGQIKKIRLKEGLEDQPEGKGKWNEEEPFQRKEQKKKKKKKKKKEEEKRPEKIRIQKMKVKKQVKKQWRKRMPIKRSLKEGVSVSLGRIIPKIMKKERRRRR